MKAQVIVVSDSSAAGERVDETGPALVDQLASSGYRAELMVIPDGIESVAEAVRQSAADGHPLVITAGGTGFGPRDLTPEATKTVLERQAPGLSEAIRAASPKGMGRLNRGVCGTIGSTLVVNVPGSVKGATESFAAVADALAHIHELLAGEQPH